MNFSTLTSNPLSLGVLILSVSIPLYLLAKKKHGLLVAWIAIGACVEIFNNLMFVSITAIKICGLLLLPYSFLRLRELARVWPGKIWLFLTVFLGVLGIYFGFIDPWPDYSGVRSIRQQAQGRSILYMGTYVLEMSVAIFLAFELRERENFRWLLRGLVAGGLLSVVGIWFERIFQFDFYYAFTGHDPRLIEFRSRGFNYEPRGAGYTATIALLTLMLLPLKTWKKSALICFVYTAYYFAGSMSAVIMLVLSSLIILVSMSFSRKELDGYLKSFSVGVIVVVVAAVGAKIYDHCFGEHIWERSYRLKENGYILQYEKAKNQLQYEKAKNQMAQDSHPALKLFEVFDAAALYFFVNNPKHLALGVGPGLMSLAASEKQRIDSLPHIGVLRKVADFGLVGFLAWITALVLMTRQLLINARQHPDKNDNALRLVLFAALSLCYGLQAKVFYIFVFGLGLAPFLRGKQPSAGRREQRAKVPGRRFFIGAMNGTSSANYSKIRH